MMALKNLSINGANSQLLMKRGMPMASVFRQNAVAKRNYFTFVDKMKDKFFKPWRHVQNFMEPDGINYQT